MPIMHTCTSDLEFRNLKNDIKVRRYSTLTQVHNHLESYFLRIDFSLLKTEWLRLSDNEKRQLAIKIFKEING